jgi:hypothetical protein
VKRTITPKKKKERKIGKPQDKNWAQNRRRNANK